MRALRQIAILPFIFFLLVSCITSYVYTSGEDFNDNFVDSIKIGESTKNEIELMFGNPLRVGSIDHCESYIYSFEVTSIPHYHNKRKVERSIKSLIIVFDKENIVKNFYYNLPQLYSSNGLLFFNNHLRRIQQENVNQYNSSQFYDN